MKSTFIQKAHAVGVVRTTSPTVIKIHSFSGRPMKEEARKKFVDGPMATAHNAALKFPSSTIVEDGLD